MYIVDVILVARLPREQGHLASYYFTEKLPIGAIVEVNFGRRVIAGVVFDCQPLATRKLDFKKGVQFELKPIKNILSKEPLVSETQLRIAALISKSYAEPLSSCLLTVLPSFWQKVKPITSRVNPEKSTQTKYIKPNYSDHGLDYKTHIKKVFQNGQSICLLTAEETVANYFLKIYSEFKPVFYTSSLGVKKQKEAWEQASSGTAQLFICTRSGLFLPFKNLGLLIIDDEANPAYKSDSSPRYHGADIAQDIAKIYQTDCLISSNVPRLETIKKLGLKSTTPKIQATVIDMVQEIRAANFTPLSRYVQDQLIAQPKSIVFVPRRGYATTTVCRHCGQAVLCPNCSTPLVEHGDKLMYCHHCGHKGPRPKQCSHCNAFGFKARGVGIDKVQLAIEKVFKYANLPAPLISRLDSDTTSNKDAVESKIIENWRDSNSGILITTHIIFSYQWQLSVPFLAILDAETASHFPDFRADEILIRQLSILGSMSHKTAIQTYVPQYPAIQAIVNGKTDNFLEEQLVERKDFGYPPFVSLTKLTYRHKNPHLARQSAQALASNLRKIIQNIKEITLRLDGPVSAFIEKERGSYVWHLILRTTAPASRYNLMIRERNTLLDQVPRGWTIDVEPLSLI